MDDDDEYSGDSPPSAGWLATFADLMSLLMCFFVLLLSFAEMDIQKFKRLAGSMASAFGVQAQIEAVAVPKGTSIIAQEFSPGRPDPTPLNQVWQQTVDNQRDTLEVQCQDSGTSSRSDEQDAKKQDIVEKIQSQVGQTEEDAIQIATALNKEIREGVIEVETSGRRIIVRIKEHGSFPSGSADLTPNFKPVLKILRQTLEKTQGKFVVEGHTDDDPISTARFRSNWALSSARAISVAHALFDEGKLTQDRFVVSGHADTRPLAPNDSAEGKARNRRVEVVIDQGLDAETKESLEVIRAEDPGLYRQVEDELVDSFGLTPDEIF